LGDRSHRRLAVSTAQQNLSPAGPGGALFYLTPRPIISLDEEARKPKSASLMPREHGAYAQIIFPLLTALVLGDLGPAPLLLVVSIVTVFLAHEPILVVIGGRGGRAQRETTMPARRRLGFLIAIGLPAGALGLWLASPAARLSALVPLVLGTLLVPFTLKRKEKTTVGELLVSFALPATSIPVAMAGGVESHAAFISAAVWAVVFALGTLTVRGIIARAKKNVDPGAMPYIAPVLSAATIIAAIWLGVSQRLPTLAALAVIPTALATLIFGLSGVHPKNLRRLGWSLVASNVAVLAALILGLR